MSESQLPPLVPAMQDPNAVNRRPPLTPAAQNPSKDREYQTYLEQVVGARFTARENAADEAMLDIFREAGYTDPKAEAEATQLAKRLGVARETLPDDLTEVRRRVREQELREFRLLELTPGVKERFQDVKLVRLLHDDLGNIQRTFGTFDWFSRNFEAGSTINEAGFLKSKLALARQNGGSLTPAEFDRLREIDDIQRFANEETGFFDEATKFVGMMIGPAVQAAGVGAAAAGVASVGGPVSAGTAFGYGTMSAMFAHSAVVEFGHQYDETYNQLVAEGVNAAEAHEAALITASAYGLGAAAAETIGFGYIGAPVARAGRKIGTKLLGLAEPGLTRPTAKRAAGTFLKETGKGFAGEVGTEGAQELMGSIAQNLAGAAVGKDTGPTLEESLLRAGEVMWRTAKGMAVIAPIGPTLHYAADMDRVKKAQGAQEMFTQLGEAAKESEVAKRSPETFAQVIDAQVAGKTALENVYIEGPKLAEGLLKAGISREQLARDLPGVAQQLSQAEKTGDDVVIPMGDFAAKIAGTDLYPAIQPSIRLANGFSADQAEMWLSEQAKNKEEAAKLVAEASTKVLDWNDQAVAVEDRIRSELAALPPHPELTPQKIALAASMHRSYVETQAAQEGTTPAAWDEQNRLTFKVRRVEDTSAAPTLVTQPFEATEGAANEEAMRDLLAPPSQSKAIGEETGEMSPEGVSKLTGPGGVRYVYSVAGKPVSVVQVVTPPDVRPTISTAFTEPASRREGFARALVKQAAQDFPDVVPGGMTEAGAGLMNATLGQAFDKDAQRVFYQQVPEFYSALERAVEASNIKSLTPEGWKKQIARWVEDRIVKGHEVFWSGLEEVIDAAIVAEKNRPLTAVRGDEEVASGTLEDLRERLEADPDLTVEPSTPKQESKDRILNFIRSHGIKIAEKSADAEPEMKWSVFGSNGEGRIDGPFDTEEEAQDRQGELESEHLDSILPDVVRVEDRGAPDYPAIADEDLLSPEEWLEKVRAGIEWVVMNGSGGLLLTTPSREAAEERVAGYNRLIADELGAPRTQASIRGQSIGSLVGNSYISKRAPREHGADGVIALLQSDTEGAKEWQETEYQRYVDEHEDAIVARDEAEPQFQVVVNTDYLSRHNRNRYDSEFFSDESEADDRAREIVDDIRDEVVERVFEDSPYYVGEDEDAAGENSTRFERYIVGGEGSPHSDYAEVALVLDEHERLYKAPSGHTFGSTESDINRVAHFRYTVREAKRSGSDEKNADVMFIDEIQSDWADAGREGSFVDEESDARGLRVRAEKAMSEADKQLEVFRDAVKREQDQREMQTDAVFEPTSEQVDKLRELTVASDKARAEYDQMQRTVKSGPFVHTTDAWVSLVLKQILMRAVTKGHDTIVLANGEQAAEVYSLEKEVTGIAWEFLDPALRVQKNVYIFTGRQGELQLVVNSAGIVTQAQHAQHAHMLHRPLRDVLGKALAEQILADWTKTGIGRLDPEDMAIGGEGMRSFYGDAKGNQTTGADKTKFNDEGKPIPAIVPKLLRELTDKFGIEPHVVSVDGLGGVNFAVTLTDEVKKQILEGFSLFQENRGEFDPATNTIFLNPKANATTVLHEMSHFWLSTLFRTANLPSSSVQSRKDAQTVLDWFKVKDLATWNALPFEEQRKHHEAWAYNAEAHFFGEGKSPSADPGQQRMFRVFGRWVRSVYRNVRDVLNETYKRIFGTDLPGLTKEVRDVFDRMLASEDAVLAAQSERAMNPLLTERPLDMTEEDWQRYQQEMTDAENSAVEQIQRASLGAMRWTTRNTADMARKIQRHTNGVRKRIEKEERAKVEQEPVYYAEQQLRHGTTDNNGETRPFKLNTTDFLGSPFGHAEHMKKLGVGPTGMLSQDGIPIDLAAQMLGWNSGNELLAALVDAPPKEDVVQQRANARMVAEHSDLLDPDKVRLMIEKAVHNEARQRLIAAELRWLAKISTPTRLMVRAAKDHAQQSIAKKRIGTVRPHEHAQAEVRERRAALSALGKGDRNKAMSHKRRELIESQMERAALEVREEIDKTVALVKKLFKPDRKLARTRNVDYVAIARWLAATFGLAPGDKDASAYIKHLRDYNPEVFEQLEPVLERAQQWQENAAREGRVVKTWKDLTVDEFRDLHEAMDALWHQSLREQQFEAAGKMQQLDDVAAEVAAQDAKNPPPKPVPVGAPVTKDFIGRGWNRLLQLVARPEHWAHRKDGAGKPGAFTRYFWRPIREAVNRYVALRNRYTKRIEAKVKELRPKLKQGVIEFRGKNDELIYVFGRGNGGFGHAELIASLLHIGNRGNLERLLTGRRWGTYDPVTDSLDTRAWDAFFQRMVNEGYITEDVMNFVQWTWDLNEEVKPLAQKAHRAVLGFYFKEVEATPVEVTFGGKRVVYRGGYMPAKLDHTAKSASRIQSLAELEKDFRKQFATTGRSFTRERASHNAEPLLLDLDLVPSHIDDVLRFSMLQPAIRDVERLAQHPDVATTLEARQPGVWQNMLLPWLQRVASQSITKAGKSPDIDNFWRYVRSSSGLSLMFANVANALQQLTGVITAALKVKPRHLFAGVWRLLTERQALYHDIAEQSEFMADRQRHQIFDSLEQIHTLTTNKSKFAKARSWVKQHGYFLQTTFQNMVDAVVWSGAYEQSIEESGKTVSDADAKQEAIRRADAAVRMSQSSFDPSDVAGYEEGTPFYRIFTMFSGYFNTLANLQADELTRMARATGFAKAGVAFQMYLVGFAMPMLLAEAVVRTARGQWDDEDEDGDVDVLTFDYLFLAQMRSFFAEVPVAGPAILAPMMNTFDNKPWNDRMTSSPAIQTLERAYGGTVGATKTLLGLKKDRKGNVKGFEGEDVRDVLTMLGIVFGVPLSSVGNRAGYVFDATQAPEGLPGAAEMTRGLVTGAARPAASR